METTTMGMTRGVTFAVEHSSDGKRWFFGKWLPPTEIEARQELSRMRAMAEGNETGVQYRAVQRTIEEMSW